VKTVFKDLGIPTLVHDKSGAILFANDAYLNTIGFAPQAQNPNKAMVLFEVSLEFSFRLTSSSNYLHLPFESM
jgi:hypothetical protein